MKILIIYICTGDYNKFFTTFSASINNFCPDVAKHVLVLSDQLNETNSPIVIGDNITVSYRHIFHHPWPITTLLKFNYIEQLIHDRELSDITHICYINGNSVLLPHEQTYWEWFYTILKSNDLILSAHALQDEGERIESYTQGGFFIVKKECATHFFECHNKRLAEYLSKNTIPQWHDETVLNDILKDGSLSYIKKYKNHFMLTEKEISLETDLYWKYKDVCFISLIEKNTVFNCNAFKNGSI